MAHIETDPGEAALDLTTLPIPAAHRMSKPALTMAWWGVCSAMFYIFLAAVLAQAYGAVNAIVGMILSVVSFGLVNAVLTRYAIRTGLSVSLFSRLLFGGVGASLATLIFFATAIYYAVFEGSVIAVAASKVVPELGYGWAAFIVVVYSVALIFGSMQRWLDKLNGVLLPFYVAGLLLAVGLTISRFGYSNAWLDFGPATGAPTDGWWHCFIAYMGVWVLMMYTFDYARFGHTKDEAYHARFNFGMPFYIMAFLVNGLAGIFMVATVKLGSVTETSVVDAFIAALGGTLGLLFVIVTQTRINTANFYLATVNAQAFFERVAGIRLPKAAWAVLVGVVVLLLMRSVDVFHYLLTALNYQGIFVTAWVGVAMAHILLSRDRLDLLDTEQVPTFNMGGLSAWLLGALLGLGCLQWGGGFASAAAPLSFGVAGLAYAWGPLRSAPTRITGTA